MPRTGFRTSPSLAIELDGEYKTHLPGDTLTGYVVVEKPPDEKQSAWATSVRLKLFGRVKTKYKKKTNNGTSIVRGRAVLFEQQYAMTKSKICQNGEHAWPFSVTIPKSPAPGFVSRGDEFKPDPYSGYLHTRGEDKNEVDVTKHPLPSVLYYFSTSGMSGKTVEAYIEYVLEAISGESIASHPIYVREQSVPCPVADSKLRIYTEPNTIKSLKLLPENADRELTFSQMTSSFFRPGKTPKYSYSVNVEYPRIIQLEHPDPIPLKIYVVPNMNPKETTICPEDDISTLPPVHVVSVEMKLNCDFAIRCPGSLWDSDTVKNHNFPFSLPLALNPIAIPVIQSVAKQATLNETNSAPAHPSRLPPPVPETDSIMSGATLTAPFSMPDAISIESEATTAVPEQPATLSHAVSAPLPPSSSSCPGPLDLGSHLSVLLGCSAASTCGRKAVSFKRQVYPTFATYSISIKYWLEWKIKMVCVGEKDEVSGRYPVVILAPSEEQESQKKRELGTQGMKKNYDDLEQGLGVAMQLIGGILQAVV